MKEEKALCTLSARNKSIQPATAKNDGLRQRIVAQIMPEFRMEERACPAL